MTFLRNCGSTSLGGLQIAGGNTVILVNGCEFLSPTNSSGAGLVITSGKNATVTNCIATGSTIGGGGSVGISISGVTNNVTVQSCTLTTNGTFATASGAGLFVYGAATVAVTNCLFTGNFVVMDYGGGAYLYGTTVTLSGNTFIGNSVYLFQYGGGAFLYGTTVTLSATLSPAIRRARRALTAAVFIAAAAQI